MAEMVDESVQRAYEKDLLAWVRKKWGDGLEILKKEPAFLNMQRCIEYVNGDQRVLRSKALAQTHTNKLRRIALETASSLTDVRPIWNFETFNNRFKEQAAILNKLSRGWWRNSQADRRLQSALLYAACGGSGYVAVTFNASLPGGGDLELVPYDPRDVIPIDPVFSDSVQDWRGVILRQQIQVETLKALYPSKAHLLDNCALSTFGGDEVVKAQTMSAIKTTVWDVLRGGAKTLEMSKASTVDLYRVFFKDDTIHTGSEPKVMGDPDANWSYVVYPVGYEKANGEVVTREEAKLYPRGRLVVCTPEGILYDGPNPYWHGLFPIVRFTLDPLPWSLLGASMLGDLIPLQDALNEGLRGLEDAIAQWVRRGVIADKNAISKANLDQIDPRKAGGKYHLNPMAGEGFKFVDGPVLPAFYLQSLEFYKQEMDDNSGVRGLRELSQLKQMPSGDTMEKYMEALSPLLRLRARSIEVSLSEVAEMIKVGFFQYYDTARRVQMLGADGVSLEDFDYDPGSLVPSSIPGESREERAKRHHKNFTFSVAPNSFLNVSHTSQKLLILQLFARNGIDIWSLWRALDIPDAGPLPAETVPERLVKAREMGLQPGPTPPVVQATEQAQIAQAMAAVMQVQQQMALGGAQVGGGGGGVPPAGGVRTDGVGPQGGRPPSGEEMPRIEQKDGGTRTTTVESR